MIKPEQISAVILAGGRGSRMGGQDKGLVKLEGKPMIGHVISTIAPQTGKLLINANRNLDAYQALGYPVIRDELDGFQGPLAGILSALDHIQNPYLLCVPCDVPGLPADLAQRLSSALQNQQGDLAVVHDGEKLQPAFALIPVRLREDLRAYVGRGERKLRSWCKTHRLALADFSDKPECFANINDGTELQQFSARSTGFTR
ncbi:MAG TPA: molybdenum cofactor guanylyltransferase [Chromatiaceae bacterium]|nr:molybdenum cofactor guanylyltransferase [Chromatiaceae bacterium]